MSVRIHVVGAYGATETEFRNALDLIGDQGNGSQRFRIGSSGKWMWANASVWQVGGSDIDDALSSLSVPALRMTSADAVLWMLTLTGAGRDRFHGVHHFTQVGSVPEEPKHRENDNDDEFPDDELEEVAGINKFVPELQFLWDAEEEARLKKEYAEEEAATVVGLDDYADYGVELPEAVIEDMKRHPDRAHFTAFMGHGPQIVAALADFGFEFERALMLQILTIGPLTEIEDHSEIGNMPRFLRTLGIDGVFPEESEADQERSDDQGLQAQHEDEQDSTFTNMLQNMSEAVERFKEAKVVPHSEQVLYEGRTGKFLRASMSDLGHIPQDHLQQHDATLAALGFRCIGDSVGDADQRQEITRCYSGHPQAVSLLSHRNADNPVGWADVSHGAMMVDFSEGTIEFHTHFEDGTSLVTTSIDAATSKPDAGIYVRAYEELPVTQLWAKHVDGIDRFKEHRSTVPVDHTKFSELVAFLAVTDEMLCRFMGEG